MIKQIFLFFIICCVNLKLLSREIDIAKSMKFNFAFVFFRFNHFNIIFFVSLN